MVTSMIHRPEEDSAFEWGVCDLSLMSDPPAPTISTDAFKALFRDHPAGVAVITADDGAGPVAMTVSSLVSVSADPPLLLFSGSEMSSGTAAIRRAETVVVHFLSSEDLWLAELGARRGADRFGTDVDWVRLPSGEPCYPGVRAWALGRITRRLDAGTAVVFVIEVIETGPIPEDGPAPLVYHDRAWHALGEASRVGH